MDVFSNYETPLWTLIGVVTGFALNYLYSRIMERRQYSTRTQETIERIKKTIHLSDTRQAIQRIADLIPQFREMEQIEILSKIGFESSLNAKTDDVTQCMIKELRWACVLYELDLSNGHKLVKKSRRNEKRIRSIQNALWEISVNIVEYRQSEKLLRMAFDLLEVLDSYSITQRYEKVIASSIDLYKSIGRLSVGVEYAVSGYKVLNFQFGIDESIRRLCFLKQSLRQSPFKSSKVSKFLNASDRAIQVVKKEHDEKVS